jgi:ATP-dependent DNA helicase RecG
MPGVPRKKKSAVDAAPRAATRAGPPGINPAQVRLLARIGLRTLADLVLHLPLRYDDETRLSTIAEATRVLGVGAVVVECVVREAQVRFKPRRTLVVTVDDGTGELTLRFLNFYPSQQRALEPGVRIRAVGEIRGGFIGAEMVHPRWRVLTEGTPMPDRLTPVYPTTQGLSQPVLQRLVRRAVAQADLSETLPGQLLGGLGLPPFDQSLHLLHAPPAPPP